jgi:polysaccharide export outer membrane protein
MRLRRIATSLLLLAALFLSGCATSETDPAGGTVTPTAYGLPPPDKITGATASVEDYEVQPLDVLELSVFQLPELTKTVEVSSTGQISLPLIGNIPAGGMTVKELEAVIEAKLQEDYLQSPEVSIYVKEQPTQQVTVDGAVQNPGLYPIRGRMTLVQVIAAAGGLDRSVADTRGILVLRRIDGRVQAAKFDYEAISDGGAADPVLYAGDVVKVDRSGIKEMFSGLKGAIPVFGMFTPFF